MPGTEDRRWTFGAVEFDEGSFELRVGGALVELERKPREVLLYLLRHAGEIVTKDELLAAVWPGRILTDNSLPKSISRIREVIGDTDQTLIKTAHGYGYRLVAPVTVQKARATPALTRLDLKPGDHPPLRPLWSLVERLGGGGQGEVWLVRHDKTREQRVFKFALGVAGLAAIKRELTLYRLLRETLKERDDFAHVLDWNLEEAPYYIELEHGAGGNLETWAESAGGLDQVPLETRLDLVAQVAEALAAAHSVGVLHKDLKPSNVLVLRHPEHNEGSLRIKLTDFGSGGVLDPKRLDDAGITRLGFTESRMHDKTPATPGYLAPEIIRGQPATVQGDVYALGVMLYQVAIADLKRPLAQGWEQGVTDPLLREDIALAVAGDPAQRLPDASLLATRLRTLDERRRQRETEHAEQARLEQEQRAAEVRARKAELAVERLRTRRSWMRTVLAILIVGASISFGLFLDARRARNEAAAAAASSQAVADFLSKDMFSQVGSRPLRNLTVKDWLLAASETIQQREAMAPLALADIHAALGRAFLTLDAFPESEAHLAKALGLYRDLLGDDAEAAIAVAAKLASARFILGRPLDSFSELAAMADGAGPRLGKEHPALLELKQHVGYARLKTGDFPGAAANFRELVEAARLATSPNSLALGEALRAHGHALLLQGRFSEAVAVFDESLQNLTAVTEAAPTGIATARLLRAQSLIALERFEEASAELSRARSGVHDWAMSDRNSQLLVIQVVEGELALRTGSPHEAVTRLDQVVKAFVEAGMELQNAEPRRWLALAYQDSGRLPEAAAMMRQARQAAERTFGVATPWYQLTTIGLADIERTRGDVAQARKLLDSVDRSVFGRLGPEHPFAAELHRAAGLIARAEGHDQQARSELAAAAQIYERRYGSRHRLSIRAQAELRG